MAKGLFLIFIAALIQIPGMLNGFILSTVTFGFALGVAFSIIMRKIYDRPHPHILHYHRPDCLPYPGAIILVVDL